MLVKIDMAEVTKAKESITSSKSTLQGKIESAKSSLKSVTSSGELSGKVKTAINAEISNGQIPLLDGYYNALSQLSSEFDSLIQGFKSGVKENSDSAIIDTEVLTQLISKISPKEEQFEKIDKEFTKAYAHASGIVEVTTVSSSGFTNGLKKAKKVLSDTNEAMGSFKGKKSSISDGLSRQNSKLGQLSGTLGMSYTSSKALKIYQDKEFKNRVSKEHKAAKKFEKEELERQRREIMRMHPSRAALDGNLTKEDLDKIYKKMNELNGMKDSLLKTGWAQRMKNFTSFLASDYNVSVAAKLNSKGKKVSKYGNWGLKTNEYLRQDWRSAKKWLRTKDWKWVEKSSVLNNSFNRNIKQFKYKLKLDKIGKCASKLDKVTSYVSAPIKKGLKKGSEVLSKTKYAGKIANKLGWIAMGVDAGFSAHKAYSDPKSSAYKDPGKAVIHAGVDQIKNAGPLEGAMIGAKAGAWGAAAGFIAGGANTIWGIVDPEGKDEVYEKIKQVASSGYDKVAGKVKNVGKSISKGWQNFTSSFKGRASYA